MKKLALLVLPLLLLGVIAVAGCGKTPGGGGNTGPSGPVDHVDMDATNFVTNAITVKAGTPFKFNDPSDTGGLHVICTGQNGKCIADSNAPTALADPGFTINPGESKTVTFDKAGTFHIACTVHPDMNLTITVQ